MVRFIPVGPPRFPHGLAVLRVVGGSDDHDDKLCGGGAWGTGVDDVMVGVVVVSQISLTGLPLSCCVRSRSEDQGR